MSASKREIPVAPEEIDEYWVGIGDWGVPDWNKLDCYPDKTNRDPQMWAWQFLRRNPDYRMSWLDHQRRLLRDQRAEAVKDWWGSFGLKEPVDPRDDRARPQFRKPIRKHQIVTIQFDLAGSLDSQWKRAKARLNTLRDKKQRDIRVRPESYRNYLRLLDGCDQCDWIDGVLDTTKVFAALMSNKTDAKGAQESFKDWREQAAYMVWYGYLSIALKGPSARPGRKK